ncbi:hypothetical protein KCP74_04715 [Salmonella enterica subsp. enterica]|nr:hypothetical protein KCP74_04715 [Salmonella enterica subsp. enterica]
MVINKADRPRAPHRVVDRVFDLFVNPTRPTNADFPIIYASALNVSREFNHEDMAEDMTPLWSASLIMLRRRTLTSMVRCRCRSPSWT